MDHPQKWRDTIDPWQLPFQQFILTEVIGYPHAGNDVFHVKGRYHNADTEAYIKVARQKGADLANEAHTLMQLQHPLAPQILDFDERDHRFLITAAKQGERLSSILSNDPCASSVEYLYEYGNALAHLHGSTGDFAPVKDRRFFHIPERQYFEKHGLTFVHDFLTQNRPKTLSCCFCHGDFHYANILWHQQHISAILDFELSGIGCREFDIAWALIVRPGQIFLKTDEEIACFMNGYRAAGSFDQTHVKYFMVLIYAYFYQIGADDPSYQVHIMSVFRAYCK